MINVCALVDDNLDDHHDHYLLIDLLGTLCFCVGKMISACFFI